MAKHEAFVATVADFAVNRQRRFEVGARLVHPTLVAAGDANVGEHEAFHRTVADLAVNRQRRLEVRTRVIQAPLLIVQATKQSLGSAMKALGMKSKISRKADEGVRHSNVHG